MPTMSADGRYVVFTTDAILDVADTDAVADVYRYDVVSDLIVLVSVERRRVGNAARLGAARCRLERRPSSTSPTVPGPATNHVRAITGRHHHTVPADTGFITRSEPRW